MKSPFLLLILTFCFRHIRFLEAFQYETKQIDVPLDHFSYTPEKQFKLRYLYNDTFWQNGPIFFCTGGNEDIERTANNYGYIWELAHEMNALIVFAEHRYYGNSLPFGKDSLSKSNIYYLKTAQALADYNYLIEQIQANLILTKQNTTMLRYPVIAFGGSYGGILAAWLRMKYPSSVAGAIASSASILAVQQLSDCDAFSKHLTSVYYTAVENFECNGVVKQSWNAIRNLITSKKGRHSLKEKLRLCKNIGEKDVDRLIGSLENFYTTIALYNYPYESNVVMKLPANPVRNFCEKLSGADILDEKQIVSQIGEAILDTVKSKCFDLNGETNKAWEFQSCIELISPSCPTQTDLFEENSWSYSDHLAKCQTEWGQLEPYPNATLYEYGGNNFASYSNILFTNGLLDPTRGGGLLTNVSGAVDVVNITEGLHVSDLMGSHENDPVGVLYARAVFKQLIERWVEEYWVDEAGLGVRTGLDVGVAIGGILVIVLFWWI